MIAATNNTRISKSNYRFDGTHQGGIKAEKVQVKQDEIAVTRYITDNPRLS
jgi:hypothetical protein